MKKDIPVRFHKIALSNYKNLENAVLDINDISILVGPNNSGKSNFFEIVAVLKNLFLYGTEGKKRIARRFLLPPFGDYKKRAPTKLEISYSVGPDSPEQILAQYSIEFLGEGENLRIVSESLYYKTSSKTGPSKKLFERAGEVINLRVESDSGKESFKEYSVAFDVSSLEIIRSIMPDLSGAPSDYILLDPLFKLALAPVFKPHNLSKGYIREIMDALPNLLELKERKSPRYKLFSESLSEILNIEMVDFAKFEIPKSLSSQSNEKPIHIICVLKERYKHEVTTIDDMSDGTRILFLMLYHIFVSDEPVVFIEEPEIGLHPNAISKLLNLLQKGMAEKQIVLSTHSSYLVNLVDPKYVTLSEPSPNGRSTFKPVSAIEDLNKRLKSKYVNFGDLFADNFKTKIDTSL